MGLVSWFVLTGAILCCVAAEKFLDSVSKIHNNILLTTIVKFKITFVQIYKIFLKNDPTPAIV